MTAFLTSRGNTSRELQIVRRTTPREAARVTLSTQVEAVAKTFLSLLTDRLTEWRLSKGGRRTGLRCATHAGVLFPDMKRTPIGSDQWHFTPTHPLGQMAQPQNFWLTALNKTLGKARAQATEENVRVRTATQVYLKAVMEGKRSEVEVVPDAIPLWSIPPSSLAGAEDEDAGNVEREESEGMTDEAAERLRMQNDEGPGHAKPTSAQADCKKRSAHAGGGGKGAGKRDPLFAIFFSPSRSVARSRHPTKMSLFRASSPTKRVSAFDRSGYRGRGAV